MKTKTSLSTPESPDWWCNDLEMAPESVATFPELAEYQDSFLGGDWWGITLLTFNIFLVQILYGAYQLLCEAGTVVFVFFSYISAGLSHTDRMSVGVKGSVDVGLTASQPLLYWVDRLLLQQHHWWKMDDVVLLLLKLTCVTIQSDGHIRLCFHWEHFLTVKSLESEKVSIGFMCGHYILCFLSCFHFFSIYIYFYCLIAVGIDPVIRMFSDPFWMCCCHLCHVCTSNCLSEESAQWGPSAKPGFRSVFPQWDSVSLDGTATLCPQNASPPPACHLPLTVSMRSLRDDRRWCKRHRKQEREEDSCQLGQVTFIEIT